jgi:hypothetical protein
VQPLCSTVSAALTLACSFGARSLAGNAARTAHFSNQTQVIGLARCAPRRAAHMG